MKNLLIFAFIVAVLEGVNVNFASGQELKKKTFIVAPAGSDKNPGTMSHPFATLEAARDAARKAGPGNHRIIVMPGEYYLSRPFELDPRDNGLTIGADTSGTVILYGGSPLTGWRPDGDKFWYVDLPGVKEGSWDFRALIVDGRMPERARLPESGTFKHLQKWSVQWLSSMGGGWARQPTREELTTMRYDPKDIPETLDTKNAEVRVYHSWDESLVGVAYNDIQRHELIFSGPAFYPPGSFWTNDYVIFNTREGMTKPGRWYLDRAAGRLVYWPMEGEDMTKVKVIAPKIERIICVAGEPGRKAEDITIRGLKFQSTTIPLKPAGMGAVSFDGAIQMMNTRECVLEGLEIANVGGVGIKAMQTDDCRITDCHIHHVGGAGAKIDGNNLFFARNHIHHTGIYFPGAVGLSSQGSNNHVYRNEIHDIPYSGIIIGKNDILIEENLIHRVMRELHDGAAIYIFGGSRCIMRGNVARDIKAVGAGTGASAYYLDEGSHHCIVEQNVSVGVPRPVHNHIARNSVIRDNVFISEEDMSLSFTSSAQMTFERNMLITPGKISIRSPHAITTWKNNKIFSNRLDRNSRPQAFKIDSLMPPVLAPERKTKPIAVIPAPKAPDLDGNLASDEWIGEFYRLDREPSRMPYSGGLVAAKFLWDKKYLYIGAIVAMFDTNNISKGNTWGKDDGIEISLAGFEKGKPVTYVIRGFANGSLQSITVGGATGAAAKHLGKRIRYVSVIHEAPKKDWKGEWAIPFDAVGLKPETNMKITFNMCAYVNEYDHWHCWEGTLGENWQVDQAGTLLFK